MYIILGKKWGYPNNQIIKKITLHPLSSLSHDSYLITLTAPLHLHTYPAGVELPRLPKIRNSIASSGVFNNQLTLLAYSRIQPLPLIRTTALLLLFYQDSVPWRKVQCGLFYNRDSLTEYTVCTVMSRWTYSQ